MSEKDPEPNRIYVEDVTHVLLDDGTEEFFTIDPESFTIGTFQFWDDWGGLEQDAVSPTFPGFSFVHAEKTVTGPLVAVVAVKTCRNTERWVRIKKLRAEEAATVSHETEVES